MKFKVKSYNIFGAVIHGAVLLLLNIIVFAFIYKPSVHNTATFWTAYTLMMVTNLGLGAATFLIFSQDNDEWLVIPLSYFVTSGISLVFLILSFIFMLNPSWEAKYVWIFEGIVLVIAIAYLTYFILAARHMNKNTRIQKEKVFYIRDCKFIVDDCATMSTNMDVRNQLKRLSDSIRYSDPMSKNNSEQLEMELKDILSNMQVTLSNDANADVRAEITKAQQVLSRRNNLVRMSK